MSVWFISVLNDIWYFNDGKERDFYRMVEKLRIINYVEINGNRVAGRELNVNNVKIKLVAVKERSVLISFKDIDGGIV